MNLLDRGKISGKKGGLKAQGRMLRTQIIDALEEKKI